MTRAQKSTKDAQTGRSDLVSQVAAVGAAAAFAGQIGGRVAMLVFRLIAANLLGAGNYGSLALGLTCTRVFAIFGTAGWDNAALRFGAEHHGRDDLAGVATTLRWCLSMAVLVGSFVAAGLFLFAPTLAAWFDDPDLAKVLRILAFGLPLFCLSRVAMRGLQAQQRPGGAVVLGDVVPSVLALAAMGVLWLYWPGLPAATAGQMAGFVGAGVLGVVLLRAIVLAKVRSRSVRPRTLAHFALTMLILMGAQPLVSNIDRFMVGLYRTSVDVGVYDASATLAGQVPLVLMAFNTIVFAQVGALYHSNRFTELELLYKSVTRWVMTLTLPLCVLLVLAGDDLLGWFGAEFTRGHIVLVVLAGGQFVNAAAGPVGGTLMMTGRERWALANTLLLGTINITGNILLIPRLGLLGAAISTAAALACWNMAGIIQVYVFHRLLPFSRAHLRPVVLMLLAGAASAPFSVLIAAPYGDWVAFVVCVGAYAALVWRMGPVGEDARIVEAVKARLAGIAGRN